ncbi:ComEA family DNA-binding protein [Micromonospora sp. U56]|uniref:ComEA family DNA-binding protein n=1 Tax=Micromonospora sp. U56 TaxID=2824900 RepID=UPI001B3739B3|nr:ComEA family DNA-binding protein [Micromonospora sp. U56]MBQ0895617.1 ComEA family DNA-binding protein [Micromonospora sp. U56]
MSHDEETMVRQRLFRLVGATSSEGEGPRLRRTTPGHTEQAPAPRSGPFNEPPHAFRPGRFADSAAPPSQPGRSRDSAPLTSTAWALDGEADDGMPLPDEDVPTVAPASRLPVPGAFDPGRRGVRALAAVAVVVVLGAGFWAWRSRPQAEPVRPVASVSAPEVSTAPEATATGSGELVVAVAGKVRRPGLVRVPAGARVADAVQAAGGALPGVDVALLNPARKVADGELILVGVAAPPGQPGAAAPPAAGDPGVPGGLVNLNTATLAQLDGLPGVGPVLAQRILTHRDQHGGFRSVGDLRQVEGIGDARYEQLKDLVTV